MTYHRAGVDTAGWYVEASEDGIHATTVAVGLPTAKAARALIDAREGRLSPLRPAPDSLPAQDGAASSTPDLAG